MEVVQTSLDPHFQETTNLMFLSEVIEAEVEAAEVAHQEKTSEEVEEVVWVKIKLEAVVAEVVWVKNI